MFKIKVSLQFFVLIALTAVAYCDHDPDDVKATLSKYKNDWSPDGSYGYEYASSNGLDVTENGIGSSYASGAFSYTSPEGKLIHLSYTADEAGYQPSGDHLPTSPPIPDYIIKSLAYIESHPFNKVSSAKK